MTRPLFALALASTLAACATTPNVASTPAPRAIPNPAIDMPAFLAVAQDAAAHRASRRLTEDQFLALMAEPGTVVLDARSAARYQQLHVRGAINLSFPDLAVDSLARTIPDKGTRILIYCNNNFEGALAREPFPSKLPSASLNLSTYVALYDYGYRNVYELGPLVDVAASKLPFEGTLAKEIAAAP